jgi:hypothetical protein
VALLVALMAHATDTDLTIYTDSLCSIQNIRHMLDMPHMMRESKHKALIEQIVQILAHRAMTGGHTYLKKVRSHTGIHGNDEADRLAKEATDPQMPIDTHVTHGEIAHEGMAWPSHRACSTSLWATTHRTQMEAGSKPDSRHQEHGTIGLQHWVCQNGWNVRQQLEETHPHPAQSQQLTLLEGLQCTLEHDETNI